MDKAAFLAIRSLPDPLRAFVSPRSQRLALLNLASKAASQYPATCHPCIHIALGCRRNSSNQSDSVNRRDQKPAGDRPFLTKRDS